jgi:hypothetical protein
VRNSKRALKNSLIEKVTIYDRDTAFCSSSKLSIANLGACMTNATADQFSVDCQDYNVATSEPPATFFVPSTTRPSPTSSSTTQNTPAPATATSAVPSTIPNTTTDAEPSLSTGAAVGIGVGATIVVVAAIALAFLLFCRRRRNPKEKLPSIVEMPGSNRQPAEASPYPEDKKFYPRDVKTAYQTGPVEAPGDSYWPGQMHEVHGDSSGFYEMQSRSR